jgi:hypothetical protein
MRNVCKKQTSTDYALSHSSTTGERRKKEKCADVNFQIIHTGRGKRGRFFLSHHKLLEPPFQSGTAVEV